jgi:large conductance mechanosensitive channel
MLEDFKRFVMRGNVVDMAVGIIIGAAFGKIVTSLVNDVIMPPIGFALGGVDFSNLYLNLSGGVYESVAAAQEAGAATINYGVFVNVVLDFLIVAAAIFLLVRVLERLRRREEAPAPATTKKCGECLSEIPLEARRCAHCAQPVAA